MMMLKNLIRPTALAFALSFAGGAVAQQMPQQQMPQQADETQMEFQQLQQRLAQIQEDAMDNNPDLQKQRDELLDLVMEKMEAEGYDPDAKIGTLENFQERMQEEDLSEDQRQELIAEAQSAQQRLQQAEQTAMQDEEVVAAYQDFQEAMITAMRNEDEEVEAISQRLQQIQMEMQQQMQQQQAPQQQAPLQ